MLCGNLNDWVGCYQPENTSGRDLQQSDGIALKSNNTDKGTKEPTTSCMSKVEKMMKYQITIKHDYNIGQISTYFTDSGG